MIFENFIKSIFKNEALIKGMIYGKLDKTNNDAYYFIPKDSKIEKIKFVIPENNTNNKNEIINGMLMVQKNATCIFYPKTFKHFKIKYPFGIDYQENVEDEHCKYMEVFGELKIEKDKFFFKIKNEYIELSLDEKYKEEIDTNEIKNLFGKLAITKDNHCVFNPNGMNSEKLTVFIE